MSSDAGSSSLCRFCPQLLSAFLFSLLLSSAARAEKPVASAAEAFGPHRALEAAAAPAVPKAPAPLTSSSSSRQWVVYWNRLAIDASGLDHTPVAHGEDRTFGEALGPVRASRAIAIVQIAVFEALNAAAQRRYTSYIGLPPQTLYTSTKAAVAQASHDALRAVFPSQAQAFARELDAALKLIPESRSKRLGVQLGADAARRILQMRADDGADHAEPVMDVDFHPSQKPGWWRQDPISQVPIAMGALWYHVRPFTMASAEQFRTPPPPALDSAEYAAAFEEVKRLGGDGVATPTLRTRDQTHAGVYWAYDGMPALCAPPRMYNQIAVQLGTARGLDALHLARLLALTNVAMADAGIAAWESKFHYQVWRPITAVREADPGTGPSGKGDGNPNTLGDPNWTPLGAPASNLHGPNFTPPFPAYPSGHAAFGGALFQTLRRVLGRDDIAFTFVSDEYNGITKDNAGQVRPRKPRSFRSLSQAEDENARSRIYLGIHWAFDASEGVTQGQQVADYVVDNMFTKIKR